MNLFFYCTFKIQFTFSVAFHFFIVLAFIPLFGWWTKKTRSSENEGNKKGYNKKCCTKKNLNVRSIAIDANHNNNDGLVIN